MNETDITKNEFSNFILKRIASEITSLGIRTVICYGSTDTYYMIYGEPPYSIYYGVYRVWLNAHEFVIKTDREYMVSKIRKIAHISLSEPDLILKIQNIIKNEITPY